MSQIFGPQRASGNAIFGPQQGTTLTGAGTITSNWLGINNSAPHIAAPFTAFVSDPTSGALVLKKTGLTSQLAIDGVHWVCSFTDSALARGVPYEVRWLRTDTGARGIEVLTTA